MKPFFKITTIVLCFFMLTGCAGITENDLANASLMTGAKADLNINIKPNGEKIKVAFVDTQDNPNSGKALYYLVEELRSISLIEHDAVLPFDPDNVNTEDLIDYLAVNDLGKHIETADTGVYFLSSGNGDKIKESLTRQVENRNIDLIICLETSAGVLVKEAGIKQIPVVLFSGKDPIGGGFSSSLQDSGQDNLWAEINEPMYKHQMQFYFDTFKFQNPGLIYTGEENAALVAYKEVADKNSFSLRAMHINTDAIMDSTGTMAYKSSLDSACQKLINVDKIDAFIITADVFKDVDLMNKYYHMFYNAGIPVVVQEGDGFVKNGALMYISGDRIRDRACFTAETILKILQGNLPRSLKQEFISTAYLSINLTAADKLEFTPNSRLILTAHKIYESYSGIQ